jgi:hypothetical protein
MPGEGSGREKPPKRMVTSASSMMPTAIVVSIQPIDMAWVAKGRIAKRSSNTPNKQEATSDSVHASQSGNPASSPMIANTAPSMRVSPCAKFTARAADHMMWKPRATRA